MTIPIIDFSIFNEEQPSSVARLAEQIERACVEVGFFALSNSGIEARAIRDIFTYSQSFFDLPLENKNGSAYTDAKANFGYQGLGMEKLTPYGMPDLKESLTMRNLLNNLDSLPLSDELNAICADFYRAAMQKAYDIMKIFAFILDVESDFFIARHKGTSTTLRMLHYPCVANSKPDQYGAGEHTDYGMMTLLFQNDVGGLEVKDSLGRWQTVPAYPDNIVINCGDLLQRWTNNRFLSTQHRVTPNFSLRSRYSIALFVDPDADVVVDCLPSCVSREHPAVYPQTNAGEFIQKKIMATHL